MKRSLRAEIDRSMSEAVFLSLVIRLARMNGWRVAHFRTARTKQGGFLTPVQGDGKGYPDLTMVRKADRRIIYAELKAERGSLEPEQKEWIADLKAVGAEVYVWKPRDWDAIVYCLSFTERLRE